LNSCDHGAAAASVVTLSVNGLGLAAPSLATGAITAGPSSTLKIPVATEGKAVLLSLESAPGFINAVWHAKVLVNPDLSNVGDAWVSTFTLTIAGVPLPNNFVIWGKAPEP
jgi:hypothetical protein